MSRVPRWNPLLTGGLAVLGLLAMLTACQWPIWSRWSTHVVGPSDGMDAILQSGLLQWSAHTWWHPEIWANLPIFHPVPGAIGFMDSLLGQAWLVWPVAVLFHPTAAALYNTAFLGSLILAALGMAFLYRASGGRWWASPIAALVMLGAPYTAAQLGHLSQLPPPFVLFSFGALIAALRRQDAGLPTTRWWWLLALFLFLQAAWGWFGFAYAILGVGVIKCTWLINRSRRRTLGWSLLFQVMRRALLPALLAFTGILLLAQPQLNLADRYPGFSLAMHEVRQGSTDLPQFWNGGVHVPGPENWLALALAALGWWRRGYLPFQQRRLGRALLVMGVAGVLLSLTDALGIPFASWLMAIALSWWAAVAVQQMVERRGHRQVQSWAPPVVIVVFAWFSLPTQVTGVALKMEGRLAPVSAVGREAVLSLPAPSSEQGEDQTEARWLLRAMATGRASTGGVSGWVPPEVANLRQRLEACEKGESKASVLLEEMRLRGYKWVELALRPDDERRLQFWRSALKENGARRLDDQPHALYETYRFE